MLFLFPDARYNPCVRMFSSVWIISMHSTTNLGISLFKFTFPEPLSLSSSFSDLILLLSSSSVLASTFALLLEKKPLRPSFSVLFGLPPKMGDGVLDSSLSRLRLDFDLTSFLIENGSVIVFLPDMVRIDFLHYTYLAEGVTTNVVVDVNKFFPFSLSFTAVFTKRLNVSLKTGSSSAII